jgi:hypothetical protein
MRCKTAEKWILHSLDHPLADEQEQALAAHRRECAACRVLEQEYLSLRQALQSGDFPAPKPYFWERLQPRLEQKPRLGLQALWKQWGLRAIPCSLAVIVFFVLAATFLFSPQTEELSRAGILLRDQNPFQDTLLLAEDAPENPNMLLLFSSLDENGSPRRKFP